MSIDRARFRRLADTGNLVPVARRLMSDQATPVLAYRRLVSADERDAPSFLFESVEQGSRVGRHSLVGAQPTIEVSARGHEVVVKDHRDGSRTCSVEPDPLEVPRRVSSGWRVASAPSGRRSESSAAHWPGRQRHSWVQR